MLALKCRHHSDEEVLHILNSIGSISDDQNFTLALQAFDVSLSWSPKSRRDPRIDVILAQKSSIVDIADVRFSSGMYGRWTRSDSSFSLHNASASVELAARVLAHARELFKPLDDYENVRAFLNQESQAALDAHRRSTAELERAAARVAAELAQSGIDAMRANNEIRRQLELDFASKSVALEAEFARRNQRSNEELARKEADLAEREKKIRDQDPKDARRVLRETLLEQMRIDDSFNLTTTTISKRAPVFWSFMLMTAVFVVLIAISFFPWSATTELTRWVLRASGTLGFATTVGLHIQWQRSWLERHADEEFLMRRVSQDINRANWVIEAAIEWGRERNEPLPERLLESVTHGLFGHNIKPRSVLPSDYLAMLLRESPNMKVRLPGGEAQLDRRGLSKAERGLPDANA